MNSSAYILFRTASFLAMLAVIIGAFGAHGLEGKLNSDQLRTFETAVKYHFYHTFAVFIAAFLCQSYPSKWLFRAGIGFVLGIVLFSGSLYLMACKNLLGIESWSWLGPITPLGGLFFIVSWIGLFFACKK